MKKLFGSAAVAVLVLSAGMSLAAPTAEQKCQQAKLKAYGKFQGCLKTNVAGQIGGKDDVSATCQVKFTTAIGKADAKAAIAAAFLDFLARLNSGTSTDGVTTTGCYADHCDWRLPTIDELRAIGTVDSEFQPDAASYYWSASTDAGLPSVAWIGSTGDGTANTDPKTTAYPVRAVRSGS